jgi:hypothetical protein
MPNQSPTQVPHLGIYYSRNIFFIHGKLLFSFLDQSWILIPGFGYDNNDATMQLNKILLEHVIKCCEHYTVYSIVILLIFKHCLHASVKLKKHVTVL